MARRVLPREALNLGRQRHLAASRHQRLAGFQARDGKVRQAWLAQIDERKCGEPFEPRQPIAAIAGSHLSPGLLLQVGEEHDLPLNQPRLGLIGLAEDCLHLGERGFLHLPVDAARVRHPLVEERRVAVEVEWLEGESHRGTPNDWTAICFSIG